MRRQASTWVTSSWNLPKLCVCGIELNSDHAHFLSCQQLIRSAMTVRHDQLVQLLAKFFRNVGAVVHVEPRIFDTNRLRPDLDILFADQHILVDVTVVHPASPSRTSRVELAAATAAEAVKTRQYSEMASLNSAKLLAFAVESYGAFGKQAAELVQILRRAADRTLMLTSMSGDYAIQALAVALQKGNCHVIRAGAIAARAAEIAQ